MRPADLADVVGVDSSSADSDSFDLPEDYGGSGGSDSSTSTSSVSDLEDLLSDNDTSDDEDSAAVRSVSQENRLTFHNVWHEEQKLIAEHRELRREHRRSSVSSQAAGAVAEGLGLRRDQLPRGRLDPRDIEMQQCSLPGCSNPGLNYFTQGGSPGTARCRFSVAFSGGGIRAAAFQAGALWRLAESGHLRDIDYIAAVSGGSYIAAAFASHILEAGRPPPGENVDAWYRDIVARTICRMQRNTPYLARDMGKNPWGFPKDGSSLLPRIFDIPILLTLFIINTVMTPAFYAIFILVPGVELFNMFVGGEMRWMFCDEGLQPGVFELFYPPKIFNCSFKVMTLALFCTFLGLTFLFWFLARVPLKDNKKSQKLYRRRRRCWLFMKSSSFVFTRIVMILVAWYMMMLIIINYRMWWSERGGLNRLCMCHRYSLLLNTSMRNQYHCSDTLFNTYPPWYETPHFNATKCQDEKVLAKVVPLERNDTVKAWGKCGGEGWHGGTACKAGLRCTFRNRWYSQCVPSPTLEPPLFVQNIDIKHPMQTFMVFWLIGFLLAILLIPFFPKLYGYVLGIAGPLSVFIVLLALVDRRVFGALYGGEEEAQTVDWIARSVLILDVVLLPFQHIARGCCHRVYRRSLRKAFFANGQDSQWGDLSSNPYCPFLLITATINEYMRPGDSIPLSEISLSPLHVGSVKTGYIDMLAQRSLSRSVALSGAAIDAFVLGKNDHIKYRFWLEMMSLSMGDFMLFDQKEQRRRHSERGTYIMLRLPAWLIGECFYGMMLFGDMSNYSGRCRYTHLAYSMATLVALVSIFLSFFAWLPCLDPLLHCLPIRGIHLLTRFYHRAETPPSLVCVTDGGLLDNTGVMQLLRRQSRRILLVYGGNDPKGKFKWLRKVLEAAGNERLASFHDPHDPGRDFREIIQDFNEDKDRPYLHLRIRYGWRRHARRPHGDLFIVTNRLPAECTDMKVEPLLTEVEIRGQDKGGEVPSDMEDLRQTDLAGCCCDCCHSHRCNFGPKFPNVHQMNQCLTPQLFNSLCRMGRRASKDAVGTVAGPPRRSSVRETGGEMP